MLDWNVPGFALADDRKGSKATASSPELKGMMNCLALTG
jgi:hypothetical protein